MLTPAASIFKVAFGRVASIGLSKALPSPCSLWKGLSSVGCGCFGLLEAPGRVVLYLRLADPCCNPFTPSLLYPSLVLPTCPSGAEMVVVPTPGFLSHFILGVTDVLSRFPCDPFPYESDTFPNS